MNAIESQPKIKRRILSFEPEPDVEMMLERAKSAGLVMGEIMNAAMRDCGQKVIKGLARKRAKTLQAISFNGPDFQASGMQFAA